MATLILDLASAPLPNAAEYLDGFVKAPANWKDPDKIAEYVREKEAERLEMAGTDIDLARITGIGVMLCAGVKAGSDVKVTLCRDEHEERAALAGLAAALERRPEIVTFGGFNFDLPLLMRRARYLGVSDFPVINLDRFKSPHYDLLEILSDRNPQRRRSLQFYAKRLGWTDLAKTLQGAEEARVPVTGLWAELEASIRHDVTATARLAAWLGVVTMELPISATQEAVGF